MTDTLSHVRSCGFLATGSSCWGTSHDAVKFLFSFFPPFQCINLTLMHGLNLCPLFFILHPFWGCGLFTRPTSLSSPNQSVADPPHAWFCWKSLLVKKDAFPLHCHKVLPIGDFLMTGVLSLILQAIYFELNSTYQLTANTNG